MDFIKKIQNQKDDEIQMGPLITCARMNHPMDGGNSSRMVTRAEGNMKEIVGPQLSGSCVPFLGCLALVCMFV